MYGKNAAFYDILYFWLYYWPVDCELSRNLPVDPSWRQVGHPCPNVSIRNWL